MTRAGDPKSIPGAPCPQCGESASLAPENAWRPFCCQRCKLLDLGEWFSGRYSVPAADEGPADGVAQGDDPTLQ